MHRIVLLVMALFVMFIAPRTIYGQNGYEAPGEAYDTSRGEANGSSDYGEDEHDADGFVGAPGYIEIIIILLFGVLMMGGVVMLIVFLSRRSAATAATPSPIPTQPPAPPVLPPEDRVQCPECKEWIMRGALRCRFCDARLDDQGNVVESPS